MVGIAIAVLAIFIPVGIFLLIKGVRQGDEVDIYNTSGKMYIGLAVFVMVFAVGMSIFCFAKAAEFNSNNYSYDNSDNNSYDGGYSSSSSFTNKYGNSTTKCVITGCNNYIAKSGDTNCCTTHSNRCGNCYCYIDSDAMYCMSCISGAIGGGNSNSNSTKECYVCGDNAYSKYGSYYYCSDCLALVKAFSD